MDINIYNKQSPADITQDFSANQLLHFVAHMNMISKGVVILLLLQVFLVDWSSGRHMALFHLRESFAPKTSLINSSKGRPRRGRRCLSTALSLLWPQVVGPVEQGVITERDYDEVPKTVLEFRLDLIRKKAAEEEQDRLIVRDYIKKMTEAQDEFYGYSYENLLKDGYS